MDKSAKICCTIFVQNYQLLYAVKEFVTSSDCDAWVTISISIPVEFSVQFIYVLQYHFVNKSNAHSFKKKMLKPK